jgi:hypothetical protein
MRQLNGVNTQPTTEHMHEWGMFFQWFIGRNGRRLAVGWPLSLSRNREESRDIAYNQWAFR